MDSLALVAGTGGDGEPVVEIKDVDQLAVTTLIWDQLGFTEVINDCVPADDQVAISPGLAVKALVLNTLGGRDPLYRVAQSYAFAPLEAVLGPGVTLDNLNDAALARHLDRLFEAGSEGVFNALSLRVIDRENVNVDEIHADTTSRLVFGEYVNEEAGAISIRPGHSKDKRPDLDQVMIGLGVTPDGLPVTAQMLSGNSSDKTWHGGMLDVVTKRLHVKDGKRLHYVGDSAVITQENLRIAKQHNIDVTGRLPRTVKVCDEVVRAAIEETTDWEELGAFGAERDAAKYMGRLVRREVLGDEVWLGVYRSAEVDKRVRHSVTHRREKQMAQATKDARKAVRQEYACAPDAQAALTEFRRAHRDELLRVLGQVHEETVALPRRPGRPRRGAASPTKLKYRLEISIAPDEEATSRAMLEESCFVVLTTRAQVSGPREILADYKRQSVVETRFPFLKDPSWAEVYFIKQPHRLEALGYVVLIALLLWCVWERRVRRNLALSGEEPLRDTTGYKKTRPTATVCRHVMKGIKLYRLLDHGQQGPWRLAAPLTVEQQRLFRFSGMAPAHPWLTSSSKLPILVPGG